MQATCSNRESGKAMILVLVMATAGLVMIQSFDRRFTQALIKKKYADMRGDLHELIMTIDSSIDCEHTLNPTGLSMLSNPPKACQSEGFALYNSNHKKMTEQGKIGHWTVKAYCVVNEGIKVRVAWEVEPGKFKTDPTNRSKKLDWMNSELLLTPGNRALCSEYFKAPSLPSGKLTDVYEWTWKQDCNDERTVAVEYRYATVGPYVDSNKNKAYDHWHGRDRLLRNWTTMTTFAANWRQDVSAEHCYHAQSFLKGKIYDN